MLQKFFGIFLIVIFSPISGWSQNNSEQSLWKITSAIKDASTVSMIKSIGKWNKLYFAHKPSAYEESWSKYNSVSRPNFEASFQQKCVHSGELQRTMREVHSDPTLTVTEAQILGHDLSIEYGQDFFEEIFFIKIVTADGKIYFGLTEHYYTFAKNSHTALCLYGSSPRSS